MKNSEPRAYVASGGYYTTLRKCSTRKQLDLACLENVAKARYFRQRLRVCDESYPPSPNRDSVQGWTPSLPALAFGFCFGARYRGFAVS
jgi:hypothetical protein